MAAAPKTKAGEKKPSISEEDFKKELDRAIERMGEEERKKLKNPPEKVSEANDGIYFPPSDMTADLPD